MKYFIDTEFKEQPGSIQLISIGIVAEDGREYYAVSKDFNLCKVWKDEWLKKNVLKSIYEELYQKVNIFGKTYRYGSFDTFSKSSLKNLIRWYGKTNKQIAEDIINFVNPVELTYKYGIGLDSVISAITRADCWNEIYYKKEFEYIKKHNTFLPDKIYGSGPDGKGEERNRPLIYNQPEFYGYYADYDWVVFCWLFGKMIDLPKGFPMYCRDLKQMMDDNGLTKEWKQKECPDPVGEHNALIDAKWNFDLYKKICQIRRERINLPVITE